MNAMHPVSVWREAWTLTCESLAAHKRLLLLAAALLTACVLYPANLQAYREPAPLQSLAVRLAPHDATTFQAELDLLDQGVQWVENRGRYIGNVVQVLLPLILGDRVGLVQLFFVSLATTTMTHCLKRVVNDLHVGPTRVGERPNGGRHNMPSGHSSMAASALGYLWRRFGVWHVAYLLPVLLATMATRVLLSAHTIPAVMAGALIGVVLGYVMTTSRPDRTSHEDSRCSARS